jgi:GMP synthase (glutamine-hydrolysing)
MDSSPPAIKQFSRPGRPLLPGLSGRFGRQAKRRSISRACLPQLHTKSNAWRGKGPSPLDARWRPTACIDLLHPCGHFTQDDLILSPWSPKEPGFRKTAGKQHAKQIAALVQTDGKTKTRIARAYAGEFPKLEKFSAVIVTGSAANVDESRWQNNMEPYLKKAAERGMPVLGICFGGQKLAAINGAPVGPNPRGVELGVVEVQLTDAGRNDPLFKGLPERIKVHESHSQHVAARPEGATLLASNTQTEVQAYVIGEDTYGVQFHPEATERSTRGWIGQERDAVGRERAAAAMQSNQDSPNARTIIHNFVEIVEAKSTGKRK